MALAVVVTKEEATDIFWICKRVVWRERIKLIDKSTARLIHETFNCICPIPLLVAGYYEELSKLGACTRMLNEIASVLDPTWLSLSLDDAERTFQLVLLFKEFKDELGRSW
jgi:hypothetical protein